MERKRAQETNELKLKQDQLERDIQDKRYSQNTLEEENKKLQKQCENLKQQILSLELNSSPRLSVGNPSNVQELQSQLLELKSTNRNYLEETDKLKEQVRQRDRKILDNEEEVARLKTNVRRLQDTADEKERQIIDQQRQQERHISELKKELVQQLGGNNFQREFIKETIERKESKDSDGLLRDILFALKEMKLKNEGRDDSKIIHLEGDKGGHRQELFEMKLEVKDLQKENNQLKELAQKQKEKYKKLKVVEEQLRNQNEDLARKNHIQKESTHLVEIVKEAPPKDQDVMQLKGENEKLKQELERIEKRKQNQNDDLKKKKRALLLELCNMISSKNNFESSFYAELTDTSESQLIQQNIQEHIHTETHVSKVSKKRNA